MLLLLRLQPRNKKLHRYMERSARIAILGYALLSFIGCVAYAHASATLGSASGYAWGEQLGWINFGCPTCTVQISDTAVTGYVWSSVAGWINLSPANAGIVNDGNGILSGYAWSTALGWVNFRGVSITGTGGFSGIAGTASSSAGRITFDCSYCNVTTDWRPAAARNQTPVSSGGGNGMVGYMFPTPQKNSTASVSSEQPFVQSPSLRGIAAPESSTITPSHDRNIFKNNSVPAMLPTEATSTPSSSRPRNLLYYFLVVIGVIFFIVLVRYKKKK
jgi:hypothetical protein